MTALTEKQSTVYELMIQHFLAHQRMPSTVEMAEKLNCAPNNVQCYYDSLENKGFIERSTAKARAIKFKKLKVQLVAA